jgi:hypothetical protein
VAKLIERSFAHCYETGAMRRVYLRGRENVLKRQLIHVGAFNLSLIFRQKLGAGTPRELRNRQSQVVFVALTFSISLTTRFSGLSTRYWLFPTSSCRDQPSQRTELPPQNFGGFRHGLLGASSRQVYRKPVSGCVTPRQGSDLFCDYKQGVGVLSNRVVKLGRMDRSTGIEASLNGPPVFATRHKTTRLIQQA